MDGTGAVTAGHTGGMGLRSRKHTLEHTHVHKALPFESGQGALRFFVYVSCLQAQVRIPAQRDDARRQNYCPPQKDWHPAGLRELQTVIFQCRYWPAPLHVQLTLPALRPPLLCFGNTWYPTDTYWNCNTPVDCPPVTCVLQLPHLQVTCIEQCPFSINCSITLPINQLPPKKESKATLTQTSCQA